MDRRDFLKIAGIAGLGSFALVAPRALRAAASRGTDPPEATPSAPRWDRTLVLVQLQGGNDGLNTVIPFADPAYRAARPGLAVESDAVVRLSDRLGLHPGLAPLMSSWQARDLAIVLGVGYDQPNRSHFRSGAIWETGSTSDEVIAEGWLARLFERSRPSGAAADGIVLGGEMGPLWGDARAITVDAPEEFVMEASALDAYGGAMPPAAVARGASAPAPPPNAALAHVLDVQRGVHDAGGRLDAMLRGTSAPSGFPRSAIGRNLATAARLVIAAGRTGTSSTAQVPVIKVTHGGFDTHVQQRQRQDRLLGELAAALVAFRTTLVAAGAWDRVLVMTYSEFGRRVAQNGSGGTDHGTAAPHFVLGGRVRGGFVGEQPSLADLDGGDLRHATDFRSLWATAIRSWWELPATASPMPASVKTLELLRGA